MGQSAGDDRGGEGRDEPNRRAAAGGCFPDGLPLLQVQFIERLGSQFARGQREVLQKFGFLVAHRITSSAKSASVSRRSSPLAKSFCRFRYDAPLSNVGGSAGS